MRPIKRKSRIEVSHQNQRPFGQKWSSTLLNIPGMLIQSNVVICTIQKKAKLYQPTLNMNGISNLILLSQGAADEDQDGCLFCSRVEAMPVWSRPGGIYIPTRFLNYQYVHWLSDTPMKEFLVKQVFRCVPNHTPDSREGGRWLQLLLNLRSCNTKASASLFRQLHAEAIKSARAAACGRVSNLLHVLFCPHIGNHAKAKNALLHHHPLQNH